MIDDRGEIRITVDGNNVKISNKVKGSFVGLCMAVGALISSVTTPGMERDVLLMTARAAAEKFDAKKIRIDLGNIMKAARPEEKEDAEG